MKRFKLDENMPASAAAVLRELERESLDGSIWILEPHRVRIWSEEG